MCVCVYCYYSYFIVVYLLLYYLFHFIYLFDNSMIAVMETKELISFLK